MKTLHATVILSVLSIFSPLWAQVPAGRAGAVLAEKSVQIQRQAAAQTLTRSANPGVSAASVALNNLRYESPLLPFLKEKPPQLAPAFKKAVPPAYAGRSLESLQTECSARGILPQDWETYSRQELAQFLSTYLSLSESAKIPSRLEASELDVKKWAHQQPDFVASNYLSFAEDYKEPVAVPITNLRILVVNDEWEEIAPLRAAVWQDGQATLDYCATVNEAIHKLQIRSNAYDIVLVDHDLNGNKKGPSLSMWIHEQQLPIPVILYSRVDISAEWAYKFNFTGRIDVGENPQVVLNFARNIVTTGKAYPNGK